MNQMFSSSSSSSSWFPGGFVVLLFREEYLTTAPEYRGKLETSMKDMEQQGKWKQTCRRVVPGYSFKSRDGLLVEFVVC